jgi:hypothetical protein
MHIANENGTGRRCMLTGQVQPMQDSVVRVMLEAFNSTQAVSLNQHGQDFNNRQSLTPHRLEKGAGVGAKSAPTPLAVVTPFGVTMNPNVARVDFAKIAALFIATPLTFAFHGASPPVREDDTPIAFSRLRYPLHEFHG